MTTSLEVTINIRWNKKVEVTRNKVVSNLLATMTRDNKQNNNDLCQVRTLFNKITNPHLDLNGIYQITGQAALKDARKTVYQQNQLAKSEWNKLNFFLNLTAARWLIGSRVPYFIPNWLWNSWESLLSGMQGVFCDSHSPFHEQGAFLSYYHLV